MKSLLTILFTAITAIAIAQPSGDIEKDTASANQLYQECLGMKSCLNGLTPPIEQAIELYDAHNFTAKVVELKGWSSVYYLGCKSEAAVFQQATEAITLATTKLEDAKHLSTYNAYLTLAVHYGYSDVDKSLEYLYMILDNPKSSDWVYFEALFHLINVYRSTGEEHKIESYLPSYEQRIKQTKNPQLKKYEIKLNEIKGMFFRGLTDDEKAILYNKEALRLNEAYQKPFDLTSLYNDISMSYGELGEQALAEENLYLFIKNTDTTGYTPFRYANFYGSVAAAYSVIKDYEKSIHYRLKSIDLLSSSAEEYPDLMAINLNNLSINYGRNGEHEAAMSSAKEVLKYSISPILISNYLHAARNFENEYDEALNYAQKGLELCFENFKSDNIFDNPTKKHTVLEPIDAYYTLGYKAQIMFKKATKASNNKLQLLKTAKEAAILAIHFQKKVFFAYKGFNISSKCQLCGYEDDLVSIQVAIYELTKSQEDLAAVFDYIEQYKGKLLLEHFTENPLPIDLAKEENRLTQTIENYYHQMSLSPDSLAFFEKKLFDENQKMEAFIQKITKEYPEQAGYFYNTTYASTADIQNSLDDNSVFVSYVIINKKLYTYIINSTEQHCITTAINDDFHDNITTVSNLLENPFLVQSAKRDKFINHSHQLYGVLLKNIEPYLSEKSRLIISPNSDLFYLPFEVLLATNDKKAFHELDFLIKKFEITYQYSATTYQRLEAKPAILNQSFIGFAPVFENGLALGEQTRALPFTIDSLYRSIDNNQLNALPNTKVEVMMISGLLPATASKTLLLENAASKKALLQAMNKDVQFLHIATHGLVNYVNPNLSALACFDSNMADGFLFANEVQRQAIKADLVVLSSCESGIGQQLNGEGLIALNRSFLIGGANNVIFSLWKVNDEYSSKLMIDFYKFYLENESYTAALRQAKLKMLQNPISANPRYWAAFVLIGE